MLRRTRSTRHRCSIAFTMIELLVVIVVLALLISLVTAVAAKVIRQQKVRNTEQIMQNVMLAVEQFAAADPLHEVYARKGRETFGKYPPYQLSDAASGNSNAVSVVLEAAPPGGWGSNLLADRLYRDFGSPGGGLASTVQILDPNDGNDDIRALYAYLRAFSADALSVIPEAALSPLDPQRRDYINPRGTGFAVGNTDIIDVLGIHDAWRVPLDYMLYVKCERIMVPGTPTPSWVVTERRPVVRSRGIEREVYDEWVRSHDDPTQREQRLSPPEKWLFSEPFCSPAAGLTDGPTYTNGILPSSPSPANAANGWARAVAAVEDYAYRPDGDTAE
jgi:type II secretory pathway pseudopilin PulG